MLSIGSTHDFLRGWEEDLTYPPEWTNIGTDQEGNFFSRRLFPYFKRWKMFYEGANNII